MPQATKTRTPKKRAPRSPVKQRVQQLRRKANNDPHAARDEAWSWIEELGRRAASDRAKALAELQELFETGRPSTGIDGQTDGILVTWTIGPSVDKLIGAVTNSWMPWVGKKFSAEEDRGENTLTDGARWPAKLVWPTYSTRPGAGTRTAFDFTTYVEPGELDPGVDVLVIDYESVSANPRLLIRQIRDELVQIVPGAHLGKMLVRLPRREQPFPALYFALKSEL